MDYLKLLTFVTYLFTTVQLGLYLATNLQWYSYKITRVVMRHHKVWWHFFYFALPFFAYHTLGEYYVWFYYLLALPSFVFWYKKLDKKLVFTWRIKRFFAMLLFFSLFGAFLCKISDGCIQYPLFIPLVVALGLSKAIETFLFVQFKKEAQAKMERMKKMKVIAITGSYGKTSIKNIIVQMLSTKYRVYATPGNVNTLAGIVRDINESLPNDTEIYVVEAGARERGDIYEITQLVQPHVVTVGKVGPQHIEYFKTLDNIILTKMEIIHSSRLEKAFIHESVTNEPHDQVSFFGHNTDNIVAHLTGTTFDVTLDEDTYHFETKVLGSFQAINITAAVMVAKYFRIEMSNIIKKVATLDAVPHRLERIDTGVKTILDDSYNGNYEGMLEAITLASEYEGRKVIVTPGLVESTLELNSMLAQKINDIFDVVILTGELNAALYDGLIHRPYKIVLKNKTLMEQILQDSTKEGDLILFANDAPNFI